MYPVSKRTANPPPVTAPRSKLTKAEQTYLAMKRKEAGSKMTEKDLREHVLEQYKKERGAANSTDEQVIAAAATALPTPTKPAGDVKPATPVVEATRSPLVGKQEAACVPSFSSTFLEAIQAIEVSSEIGNPFAPLFGEWKQTISSLLINARVIELVKVCERISLDRTENETIRFLETLGEKLTGLLNPAVTQDEQKAIVRLNKLKDKLAGVTKTLGGSTGNNSQLINDRDRLTLEIKERKHLIRSKKLERLITQLEDLKTRAETLQDSLRIAIKENTGENFQMSVATATFCLAMLDQALIRSNHRQFQVSMTSLFNFNTAGSKLDSKSDQFPKIIEAIDNLEEVAAAKEWFAVTNLVTVTPTSKPFLLGLATALAPCMKRITSTMDAPKEVPAQEIEKSQKLTFAERKAILDAHVADPTKADEIIRAADDAEEIRLSKVAQVKILKGLEAPGKKEYDEIKWGSSISRTQASFSGAKLQWDTLVATTGYTQQ